jgi:hypothetical protein
MITFKGLEEFRCLSIKTNGRLRFFGVVADHRQEPFKFSIQPIRYQFNHYFTPAAGRDIRIPPYQIDASGIFDLRDIKKRFSEVVNGNIVFDRLGGYQITGIDIGRVQNNRCTRSSSVLGDYGGRRADQEKKDR